MLKPFIRIFYGVVLLGLLGFLPGATPTAMAADKYQDCPKEPKILTMEPWYHGLCDSKGEVAILNEKPPDDLTGFVTKLLLNLLSIALQIGGYVAVGFVIWGGMKYIIAAGEPGKLVKAKTTIQNALIGLLIVVASVAIVDFIQGLF